jgi:hypothetical protein
VKPINFAILIMKANERSQLHPRTYARDLATRHEKEWLPRTITQPTTKMKNARFNEPEAAAPLLASITPKRFRLRLRMEEGQKAQFSVLASHSPQRRSEKSRRPSAVRPHSPTA